MKQLYAKILMKNKFNICQYLFKTAIPSTSTKITKNHAPSNGKAYFCILYAPIVVKFFDGTYTHNCEGEHYTIKKYYQD